MQDFMRQYPKAKVRLEFLHPSKVYEAVLNEDVDLGIVSYPTATPRPDRHPAADREHGAGLQPEPPPGQHETGDHQPTPRRELHRLRPGT